jgi:hypothetical protein
MVVRVGVGWMVFGVCLLGGCGKTEARDDTQATDDTLLRGRVIDQFDQPFEGVEVVVGDVVNVTDEEGRFSVSGAGARYDVVLRPDRDVYAYQGMSSREPVLMLHDLIAPTSDNHYVPVTITFPPSEADVQTTIVAALEGAVTHSGFSWGGQEPETRKYSLTWMGDESCILVLYAFEYEADDSTGAPARYLGYDEWRGPIDSSKPFQWSVQWRPTIFETAPLRATAVLPDDYAIWNVRLSMRPAATARAFWFLDGSLEGPDVSMLVPDVPGATFDLAVLAASNGSSSGRSTSGLVTSAAPTQVMVEPAPSKLDPPPEATGITQDTRFSWVKGSEGITFANVLPKLKGTDAPRYYIATADSELKLPDLSLLGEELPSAAEYEWAVFVTTAASLDEFAAGGTSMSDLRASTYAYSGYQTFTTR